MKRYNKNIYLDSKERICKDCGNYLIEVSHKKVGDKQIKQPFYYRRWYKCEKCNKNWNFEQDKIWTNNHYSQVLQREEEIESFFKNL